MNCRLIVSAVIEKDGKILVGRKPKDIGPYPNALHLPGGGVDMGEESLLEAVKREIMEETGVEMNDIRPINFDEDYTPNRKGERTHYIFLVYKAKYKKGELKAEDDLKTLEWIDKSELANLPLANPSIKLFKTIGWIK